MAKLYFKYGAMGSSKTAQALITKFNYEERGMKVWLIKPSIDDRDGRDITKSRIGLFAASTVFSDALKCFGKSGSGPVAIQMRTSIKILGADRFTEIQMILQHGFQRKRHTSIAAALILNRLRKTFQRKPGIAMQV